MLMMALWISVIVVEVLALAGLAVLYRKLCRFEVAFEIWQAELTPALRRSRGEMSQLLRALEKLEIQMEALAAAGGWKRRVALWFLDRVVAEAKTP